MVWLEDIIYNENWKINVNVLILFFILDDLIRLIVGDLVILFNRIKIWFSIGREYYYLYLGYNVFSLGFINILKFCL